MKPKKPAKPAPKTEMLSAARQPQTLGRYGSASTLSSRQQPSA
jgi:hypothetical protein